MQKRKKKRWMFHLVFRGKRLIETRGGRKEGKSSLPPEGREGNGGLYRLLRPKKSIRGGGRKRKNKNGPAIVLTKKKGGMGKRSNPVYRAEREGRLSAKETVVEGEGERGGGPLVVAQRKKKTASHEKKGRKRLRRDQEERGKRLRPAAGTWK